MQIRFPFIADNLEMSDGLQVNTFPQVKQRTGMIIRLKNSKVWKGNIECNCGGMGWIELGEIPVLCVVVVI